ncbi:MULTISPECIES: ferredoxin [unclassified Meridianimarinicoccus]|uniref:ferredoxin n=1 Tax=unclassified Meridianimarinicoccus TaxID=2923344 RepID=UPI001868676C|nr:ferredoxin [Fluviibacterium sp. MJW13]
MTGPAAFQRALADCQLLQAAHVPLEASDGMPPDFTSIALVAPQEPGFWTLAQTAPEMRDGLSDPLDRLSRRLVTPVAASVGGMALFPSDGPPYPPFVSWALRSARIWAAPMGLLVSRTAGLWVSFRAAVALPWAAPAQPAAASPCDTCAARPCLSACPVSAFSADRGYDLAACHGFLDRAAGQDCMTRGCAARRACPLGAASGRHPDQSAFHMRAFHPCQNA